MRILVIGVFVLLMHTPVVVSYAQSPASEDRSVLVLDVDKAVAIALEQNPRIQVVEKDAEISAAEVRAIRSLALPRLSLHTTYSRNIKKPAFFARFGGQTQKIEIGSNNAINTSLDFSQRIFESGQLGMGKAIEISRLLAESANLAVRQTRSEVIFEVRRAFYAVLLNEQVVNVLQEAAEQARAHLENVRSQFEQGVAAEFDVLRAQVQVAEVQPQLISARNNLELAKNMLKNALGLPLDQPLQLDGSLDVRPLPLQSMQDMLAEGLRRRPELQRLEMGERIAGLNVSVQKGSRLPSISIGASYLFQGQSNDFQFSPLERNTSLTANVNLRFSLFDGFETSAKIQKAKAELEQIRRQKAQVHQAVEIEILQAAQQVIEAGERLMAQQQSVRQAEKAYQIAEVRYEQGIGTQLELFDARVALSRIKLNYWQAAFDYRVARFAWEKAMSLTN